jgi:hypothetical protein
MYQLKAVVPPAAGTYGAGNWDRISDVLTALASVTVVLAGIFGIRYLHRANVRVDCEIVQGLESWLILRARGEIDNRGLVRLSFVGLPETERPRITVAEVVDIPDLNGRTLAEVRTWNEEGFEGERVDPGELASWVSVFHLPPPFDSTVAYRVTLVVPIRPPLSARASRWLGWSLRRLWALSLRAPGPVRPPRAIWWEDQTLLPSASH